MATTESKKRKREVDLPRITFDTPSRTFERLFKERSLQALRSTVIKKLGLGAATLLEFSQIRNGKSIDLEDEDDFDAFRSYAMSSGVAEVKVNILGVTEAFGIPPQLQTSNNLEELQAAPASKKKKAGHNDLVSQVQDPMALAQVLTTVLGPSPVKKAKSKKASDVVNPSAPATGVSEPQNASPSVVDVVETAQAKQKSKRKEKQALQVESVYPSSAAPVEDMSTETASKKRTSKATSESGKAEKKSRSSKIKHATKASVADAEMQQSSKHASGFDAGSSEKTALTQPAEQEAMASQKPSRGRKEKNDQDKKSRKKSSPVETATAEPVITPVSNASASSSTLSPIPSITSPTLSVPAPIPAPSVPPVEPKRPKSKKLKVSTVSTIPEPTNIELPTEEQSHAESSAALLPNGKKSQKSQPEDGQSSSLSTPDAPPLDGREGKKRRLESDGEHGTEASSASGPAKAKKRKIIDGAVISATTIPIPIEASAGTPIASEAAPVTGKPKASARKKRIEKPGYEEAFDEALDGVVADIVRKRVSESSRQTASTAPVTIAASSASNMTGVNPAHIVEALPDTTIVSKSKQKSKAKAKKGKETEVMRTAPSIATLQPVPSTTVPGGVLAVGASAENDPSQGLSQRVNDLRSDATLMDAERNIVATTSQPQSSQGKTKFGIRHQETSNIGAAVSSWKCRGSVISMDVLPFASSGSSISEIVIQGKDEGSSSESDSDSDSSDSDNKENVVTASKRERNLPAHPISLDVARDSTPGSLFPIGDFDFSETTDLDALLKPKDSLSWRDIPLSPENEGDDEKEKLLSGVEEEEEEEEEKHMKAPRSSLPIRRASSSPSADEDDDDDDSPEASENVTSGLTEDWNTATDFADSPRETGSAPKETENDFLTEEEDDRVSSAQANEVAEDEPVTSRPNISAFDAEAGPPLISSQSCSSQPSQLPFLKDVNGRGESVLTEGVADLAVSQAMEEDNTVFFSGLGKLGREPFSTELPMVDEKGSEDDKNFEPAVSESVHIGSMSEVLSEKDEGIVEEDELVSSRASSVGNLEVIPDSLRQSEERDPSPVPGIVPLRPEQSASQGASNTPAVDPFRPPSRQSTPVRDAESQVKSTFKVPGPGTPGTIRRMKDRHGRIITPKEPPLKASVHDQALLHATSRDLVEDRYDTTEQTTDVAHRPRYVTRRSYSVNHSEPSSSQLADSILSKSTEQRKRKAEPTVPTLGEAEETERAGIVGRLRKRGKKPELEITLPPPSQNGRMKSSQAPKYEASSIEPIAAESSLDDGALSKAVVVNESVSRMEGADDSHSLGLRGSENVDVGLSIVDAKSGSTTEVERSVNGDSNIVLDNSTVPPSTQFIKGGESPEQRVPSPAASSATEDSDEDDDGHVLMKKMHDYTSRPSLNGARSLQDIAKRQDLFSPAGTPRPPFALSPVTTFGSQAAVTRKGNVGDADDDDDDSSSSSDSDSDSHNQNNIPKEKRAGSVVSKPSRGLKSVLSFLT